MADPTTRYPMLRTEQYWGEMRRRVLELELTHDRDSEQVFRTRIADLMFELIGILNELSRDTR